jgi:hypothetical protein
MRPTRARSLRPRSRPMRARSWPSQLGPAPLLPRSPLPRVPRSDHGARWPADDHDDGDKASTNPPKHHDLHNLPHSLGHTTCPQTPWREPHPTMAARWPRHLALRRYKPVTTKLNAWEASVAHRECSCATGRRGEAVWWLRLWQLLASVELRCPGVSPRALERIAST